KRSIKLEDKIIVRTQIDSVNGAQAKVLFFILNKETNKVAAEGYLLYTMISTKSGRPVRIPDDIIEMYSK
ncbi:MAG: thioesterase, partial [Ignavibacteria bacterium]|nr:thioesterase [Ignavibacteria bacterium]